MFKKRSLQLLMLAIITAIVGGGLALFWHYQAQHPSTDDAYVQANIADIAPRVTGKVAAVFIQDHQAVKAGQPLFAIDKQPFLIAVNKAQADLTNTIQAMHVDASAVKAAEATLTQRQAELKNTQKSTQRTLTLVKRKLASQADADQASQNLSVAEAAVVAAQNELQEAKEKLGINGENNASLRAAKATLAQAQLDLGYTMVRAPHDGVVENVTIRPGSTVTAYQSTFSLIENRDYWASANFKETQLTRIRTGQPATIHIDMYPDQIFNGIVSSISTSSGASFALLPPENATGNWVKVTQRFPVRIKIISRYPNAPLRIGSSCTVTIDTTQSPTH